MPVGNGEKSMEDTICAISTPVGVGGISIIRVSGDKSIEIVNSIFKGKNLEEVSSHTINYGHIFYDDENIDEVLVSVMKKPKTFTAEDVVEINLHGGIATTNKVLEILLNNGCRQAMPGEFTKRAFLNGRIDLVEAEAVGDVIAAENENARKLSMNQLTGKLSSLIRKIKKELLELESKIEVNIDYPEYEDLEDMTQSRVGKSLNEIKDVLEKMIEESKIGKIISSGINIAIIGRPNVGKSSLLNAFLGEEKAIVTDIEGTTRDIVEGKLNLNGMTLNFIDTAGIRETEDIVEKIGVDKSLKSIESADLVILVLDGASAISEEERNLMDRLAGKRHIIFINKSDLRSSIDIKELHNVVRGNTVFPEGLDELKKKIKELFEIGEMEKKDFTYISNARQLSLIEQVKNNIESAISGIENTVPVDIVVIDIREARRNIDLLLGEVFDEELIDELFDKFCLGK